MLENTVATVAAAEHLTSQINTRVRKFIFVKLHLKKEDMFSFRSNFSFEYMQLNTNNCCSARLPGDHGFEFLNILSRLSHCFTLCGQCLGINETAMTFISRSIYMYYKLVELYTQQESSVDQREMKIQHHIIIIRFIYFQVSGKLKDAEDCPYWPYCIYYIAGWLYHRNSCSSR